MNGTPICPKCGTTLKEDYGMVSCGSCGVFLFIDMEGNAHVDMSSDGSRVTNVKPVSEAPAGEPSAVESQMLEFTPIEMEPMGASPESSESMDQGPELATPIDVQAEPPTEAAAADDFSMDEMLGFAEPQASASEANLDQSMDISEYANSEVSQAKDGLFLVTLFISGIDSKEVRQSLREAIEDSRFGWDTADVMAGVTKGTLKIGDISPVKASILVNRIKKLPIRVRWEQHAVTQMESSR